MSTEPKSVPRRARMTKRNQEFYEKCLEWATPLRARIDELQSALVTANCDKERAQKRVGEVEEEMNRIIRNLWDVEGERDGLKARAKTVIAGRDHDNIVLRDTLAIITRERDTLRTQLADVTAERDAALEQARAEIARLTALVAVGREMSDENITLGRLADARFKWRSLEGER